MLLFQSKPQNKSHMFDKNAIHHHLLLHFCVKSAGIQEQPENKVTKGHSSKHASGLLPILNQSLSGITVAAVEVHSCIRFLLE